MHLLKYIKNPIMNMYIKYFENVILNMKMLQSRNIISLIICLSMTFLLKAETNPATNKSQIFERFVLDKTNDSFTNIPDFSYAGYHYSEKPIPEISKKTHVFFDVTKYGAVANDDKSDYDAVKKAIIDAEKTNSPAVIYFPPGRFNLREEGDLLKGALTIRKSNLVLLGSGAYAGGTEIFICKATNQNPLFLFTNVRPGDAAPKLLATIKEWVNPYTAVLDNEEIAEKPIKKGQLVSISCQTTKEESQKLHGDIEMGKRVKFYMVERHEIASIKGDKITFREPLLDSFQLLKSIYEVAKPVTEVGVQNIAFVGNHRERYGHYINKGSDGYVFAEFINCRNAWVRDVRCTDLSQVIKLYNSSAMTMLNVNIEGSPGHIITRFDRSDRNMWAYSRENSWYLHGLGASWGSAGNVFLRCSQYAGIEGHGSGPYASLFDLNSGIFKQRFGGDNPHHNRDLIFWNWLNLAEETYNDERIVFLYPSIIGMHGATLKINPDAAKSLLNLESNGKKVTPESLFESQLAIRLGKVPTWMKQAGDDFEKYSRFAFINIKSPLDQSEYSKDQTISVELEMNKAYDTKNIRKIEILATQTHYIDGNEEMIAEIEKASFKKEIKLASGVWSLRARLFNVKGEFTDTQPVTVFVGNSNGYQEVKSSEYTTSFWQTRVGQNETTPTSISATSLLDGNTDTYVHIKETTGIMVLDFGKKVTLSRFDVAPGDKIPGVREGMSMEIQGCNNENMKEDLTNQKDGWNHLGIIGPKSYLLRTEDPVISQTDSGKINFFRLWLPKHEGYRFYKVILRPQALHWGELKVREIRIYK